MRAVPSLVCCTVEFVWLCYNALLNGFVHEVSFGQLDSLAPVMSRLSLCLTSGWLFQDV